MVYCETRKCLQSRWKKLQFMLDWKDVHFKFLEQKNADTRINITLVILNRDNRKNF